jgi:hypothetical protein
VITPTDYALIDNLTVNSISTTPLPGTLPLFGSALLIFPSWAGGANADGTRLWRWP